ncbi:MAG: rhomboid family intramembrane serine protease [Planctomycetota bacterium]|nr:rhomboid family intramembrane serine protease [Planctomycetota bacterium]
MLLPLSDSPNYSTQRPWVNYALVAANVLAFIWAQSAATGAGGYGEIVREWGFVPASPTITTYFTSMFMHGDFMHLAGNMLWLWIFGDNVEARLGHVGYLCFYLAAGFAAVLLFQVLSPGSLIPLVGASGAIFGVTGFYFLAFPYNSVRVLFFFFFILFYDLRARWVLGFYFVVDLFNMLIRQSGGGGVAYAAHVGGFLFGLGMASMLLRLLPSAQPVERRRAPLRAPGPDALIQAGLAHARAGRVNQAYEAFETVLASSPDTEEAGFAALQMGIIRGRILGDFEGARRLLSYALDHLVQPLHVRRAQAELSEIST